ncbi:solute carrier family 35 member G1-like [Ptychodera flava]|uniref:solute carrier family 35 member G1-like n=1 Tax=Ptychodera flava TaxID=63121 RepID=UPI003969BE65
MEFEPTDQDEEHTQTSTNDGRGETEPKGCYDKCDDCCGGHLQTLEGVLLALLSGVTFAASSVFTRLASDGGVPRYQTVFINCTSLVPVVLPFLIYYRVSPFTSQPIKDTLLLALTGFGRAVVIVAQTISFTFAPSGSCVALLNGITAVGASLLASIFLGEVWRLIGILAAIVDVVGVFLLIRPPFLFGQLSDEYGHTRDLSIGYGLIAAAALILSAVLVSSRALMKRVSILNVIFYAAIMSLLLSLVMMLSLGDPVWPISDVRLIGPLCGMTMTYAVSFYSLYRALQVQEASTVTVLRNISIFVAFLLQHYVLEMTPTVYDIVGATLIFVGTSAVSVDTWWYKTHPTSDEKQQLLDKEGHKLSSVGGAIESKDQEPTSGENND